MRDENQTLTDKLGEAERSLEETTTKLEETESQLERTRGKLVKTTKQRDEQTYLVSRQAEKEEQLRGQAKQVGWHQGQAGRIASGA